MASHGETSSTVVVREVITGKVIQTLFIANARCQAFSPDGRMVALGTDDGKIALWDLFFKVSVANLSSRQGGICSVKFSHDGKLLASASKEGSVVVWDVAQWTRQDAPKATQLALAAAPKLWKRLADSDAATAYDAILWLRRNSQAAFDGLDTHLQPVPRGAFKDMAKWIAALDSDRFKDRQQAMSKLEDCGEAAVPALESVLAGQPTLETRQRVTMLLNKREGEGLPLDLKRVRAVRMLGTPGNAWQRRGSGLFGVARTRRARSLANAGGCGGAGAGAETR